MVSKSLAAAARPCVIAPRPNSLDLNSYKLLPGTYLAFQAQARLTKKIQSELPKRR